MQSVIPVAQNYFVVPSAAGSVSESLVKSAKSAQPTCASRTRLPFRKRAASSVFGRNKEYNDKHAGTLKCLAPIELQIAAAETRNSGQQGSATKLNKSLGGEQGLRMRSATQLGGNRTPKGRVNGLPTPDGESSW